MAGTNREARLNLVITARDEAKQVVESLATSLQETFDGLGAKLAEKMNMADLKESIMSTLTPIKNDLKAIGKALQTTGDDASAASKTIQMAMNDTKSAVDGLKTPFTNDMQDMIDTLKRVETEFAAEAREAKAAATDVEESLKQTTVAAQDAASTVVGDMKDVESSLKRVAESSQGVKEALDFANLQMAGQQIQQTGQSITDFFGNAVSAAADFDQNVTNTAASLNSNLPTGIRLSADQLKALNQEALNLGQSGFFSANQIADAMNTLAKQGIDYQTIMGGAIQTVSSVAAANQEDVNQTANVVSDIINEMGDSLSTQFGPDLKAQMTGVGDAMTGAMHHARISMDDFLNSMKYAGPQASAMGIGIGELSASIALLGEHGIRGSQAGTTLRRELTNLTPQSKEAAAAMKQLGLITADGTNLFYKADGSMKSLADVQKLLYEHTHNLTDEQQQFALKTIFGQYALSGMTAIANTAPAKFSDLTDAMHKTGVTQQLLADKSEGWGLQIQKLKAHYDTITKAIGESLKPVITDIMSVIQSLMTKWDALSPSMQRTIVLVAAVTGVVLLVGGALLALIGTIGMLATGFVAALPVLSAVASAFLPVVAIVGVLVAVIYGLKVAWDRDLGGIREKTTAVWSWIKTQFDAAISYISPKVSKFVGELTAWWTEMGGSFGKAIHNIWSFIEWLSPLWKAAWFVIKTIIKGVFDAICDIVEGAFKIIKGALDFFIDLFAGNWKHMWQDVKDILSGAVELIWGYIQLSFFGRLLDGVGGFIADFGGFFVKLGKDVFGYVGDMVTGVKSQIDGLIDMAMGWGSNLITMFVAGITASIHKVTEAISGVAGKVKDFLGFHSPTKEGPASDSDTWMPNMMTMLTSGIVEHKPKIEAAVNNVALGLKTSLSGGNVTNVNNAQFSVPTNAQGRQVIVNITVDGRSARSDDDLAEKIAQKFRTQIAMAVG